MKTERKENYLLIRIENESITDFSSDLTKRHEEYQEDNVVVDILKFGELELEELLSFLELSDRHRMERKSFVLVNDAINIDRVPDELIVVPTLQEAEDIIQMEEIERDLEE